MSTCGLDTNRINNSMKLKELTSTVTLWEGDIDGIHCSFTAQLNEGKMDIAFKADDTGKVLATKRNKNITYNPHVAAKAVKYGTDAIMSYLRIRRHSTRFIATDYDERKFYSKLVKDLIATGKYRQVRRRNLGHNVVWEIRQK